MSGPAEFLTRRPLLCRLLVVAFYSVITIACFFAIRQSLEPGGFGAILPAFASLDPVALVWSALTVVCAFAALWAMERLSLSDEIGGKPTTLVMAPFVATTLSLGAGFGVLSGTALRIRLYAPFGIGATTAIYAATTTTTALLLGGVAVAAAGTLFGALRLGAPLGVLNANAQLFGAIAATALAGLILFAGTRGRSLTIFKHSFRLPSSLGLLLRLALGAFNWGCSAIGLYLLLPEAARPSLLEFATTVSALKLVALMTGAPGGIGVFEAFMLSLAGGEISPDRLTAALIVYRIMSFVTPIALAAVGAAFLEGNSGRSSRTTDRGDERGKMRSRRPDG